MAMTRRKVAKIAGTPRTQAGFVLVTALLFLVLVLLLGLSAFGSSRLLNTVASNERAVSMAEAGANAALRRAEHKLYTYYATANGTSMVGDATASSGVYSMDSVRTAAPLVRFMIPERWSTEGSTPVAANDVDYGSAAGGGALADQPSYIVEDLGPVKPGSAGEGGATGSGSYGSGAIAGGNLTLRAYRITAKSLGPNRQVVKTLQSIYAGHAGG